MLTVEQNLRHALYAHVKPTAHWLDVVQIDPSGPPPARMQLTDPFVLFVTSHVWFAAQPHCGSTPHAFDGGVVVHDPPLLEDDDDDEEDDDVDPPASVPPLDDDDDDEDALDVDEPLDDPPLEVDEPPDDPPLEDVSPLEDSPLVPLDPLLEPPLDPRGGMVSLGGGGSVLSFVFAGVIGPLTSGVSVPSAQATIPRIETTVTPAKRTSGDFIGASLVPLRCGNHRSQPA